MSKWVHLNQLEREKFAAWLTQEAQTSNKAADRLNSPYGLNDGAERHRSEAKAMLVVAKILDAIKAS